MLYSSSPTTNVIVARSSELRQPRLALGHIGIPNRRDTLAAHVRWARVRFYLLHQGRRSRRASSIRATTDALEDRDLPLPAQTSAPGNIGDPTNMNADLFGVGGQFD